jgi:hypothetical protein
VTLRGAVRGESPWLFLLVLAVLGCFVNTRNQLSWNVQHAWVESLAERGTMQLEGSPTWQFALPRLVDVWTSPDGHTYAKNAPGTCFSAALSHLVLHRVFGLSYQRDFDLTSSLVVLLTTCVATALVFVVLYRLARETTGSRWGGACIAFAYAFGTLAFPYSGALYQHQAAAIFFFSCFALAWRERGALAIARATASTRERRFETPSWRLPLLEGLLLGLGTFFSFAYLPMALALAGYCLLPLARRRTLAFAAGAAIGVAPLLVLNALYYGGPLTTVYQAASDYQVTTLEPSLAAVARRLHFYFTDPTTGLFYYSPVLAVAVGGLLAFPRELRREQLAIAAGVLLTLAHLLVSSGIGALQFGPRLLLPTLPFLTLGLLPLWMAPPQGVRAAWPRLAFALLLVPSVVFCGLGALGTTVFRDVARHNAWYVFAHALAPPVPEGIPVYNLTIYRFPLRPVLVWAVPVLAVVAGSRLVAGGRERDGRR